MTAGSGQDRPTDQEWAVGSVQARTLAVSKIHSFVEERFEMDGPDGPMLLTRSFVTALGAVAVLAVDDDDRVACVRQYRHPVGRILVEPPAGLLDHAGEDPLAAAMRELAEEALLAAGDWKVLVDLCSTPGGSSELVRIFLATDLSPAPRPDGFVLSGEEAVMDVVWYPLAELVEGVLAGRLSNPTLTAAVLALSTARSAGIELRPADSPWPARAQQYQRVQALVDELGR